MLVIWYSMSYSYRDLFNFVQYAVVLCLMFACLFIGGILAAVFRGKVSVFAFILTPF